MSKQRVGLLTQMRTKLTLDEEDLVHRNSKEEVRVDKVEGGEPGQRSESKTEQLPEGSPPKTLETMLLSDTW